MQKENADRAGCVHKITQKEKPMSGKTRIEKIEDMLALEPADPELHYMLAME